MEGANDMNRDNRLFQLQERVEQQGRTVCQLLKIIAATNSHVKDLQIKYEQLAQYKESATK